MFEVGKKYEIRMIVGGEETTMGRTIEKYDHPLLKFSDIDVEVHAPKIRDGDIESGFLRRRIFGEIINVTSPNFISAVLKE